VATCKDVYGFLDGVRQRTPTATLADADLTTLTQLNIVSVLTADQYRALTQEVSSLASAQQQVVAEQDIRNRLASAVQQEAKRTHSILFHFEGRAAQQAEQQREAQDEQALRAATDDLTARTQAFDQLLAKRSLLETVSPLGDRYVGLTSFGTLQVRDLGVRLYRYSDTPFADYWQQVQGIRAELVGTAGRGAQYVAALTGPLGPVDRSYLWSIALGLAKQGADIPAGVSTFVNAYSALGPLAHNTENRLLAAEVLTALPRPVSDVVGTLTQVEHAVRQAGVPNASSLGVASLILLGQRADGTLAIENLRAFLRITRSFESAALLAILNRSFDELSAKFGTLRQMFFGWGYGESEDVELASAYLTLSELPIEGISTKLAIIARGMNAYLQYPLVAASILAAVPVLEANETLNVLEEAYEIVGARAMPMPTPELICLAVRMVHGIRNELVGSLDATAAAAPAAAGGYAYATGPPFFYFVPVAVAHAFYYSTFSGIGGVHPGHAHFAGGFGSG
jgi:hypothetical protein